MSLIILLLDVVIVSWVAYRLYQVQPPSCKPFFWPALSLKIIAGMAVGALYFFHYGLGDTISYWQDGVKISGFIRAAPSDALAFFWDESSRPDIVASLRQQAPRSLFFSKISGLLALVAMGNYWVMSALISFVSFVGAWFLFRRATDFFPLHRRASAVAFLLCPSVVFWSSGLIKESLGLAALFVLIALSLSFLKDRPPKALEWILAGVSLWIGWNLKYYWMGIFLPVALPTLLVAAAKRSRRALARYELVWWTLLFLVFIVVATSIHPNFYPSRFMEVMYQSNLEFTHLSDPPRIVQYLNLEPSISSMLMNAPAAWVAGLFRPFIWEAFNLLSSLAAMENLVLLVVVVMALPAMRKLPGSPHRLPILASLVYVVLLTTFLALSTPNFGTLSRYKIGAVPILLFICLSSSPTLGRWIGDKK